jgi:hypothetical protein
VHAQAGQAIKLFVWASITIKTFGAKKIEESNSAILNVQGFTSQPGKV